ncbi:arsenate reductase ArsC [Actinomadura fulvescens]|uniref:Arsenate reductase ArsC n=1 Tax=Actinomadura fulvescens TaxID=46160 RepID=A0ABN3QFG9_9ACTN
MTDHGPPGRPPLVFPENVLYRVSDELADDFAGTFSRETIDRYLIDSYDLLRMTAKVGIHLPVLASRFAADRLTALAYAEGLQVKKILQILFVCVHNAGRSQLAAALLHKRLGEAVQVRSAGSSPGAELDPGIVTVATEIGLDLSHEIPKPLTDEIVRAADIVVTLGCGDACPIYPGKRYLDWPVADPEGASPAAIRRIATDIDTRLASLIHELLPDHPADL